MQTQSIYFIDKKLSDSQSIIDSLNPTTTYYLIDSESDGLTQMASILAGYSDLDAIHVFSHGSIGSLSLGNSIYNQSNLAQYQAQLEQIGNALSATGDILLYGCNVGQGSEGQSFIDTIASYTGADVAASDDLTGSSTLGGDWELEVKNGNIEANIFRSDLYQNILADDYADTKTNAYEITLNTLVYGNIDPIGDVDYFKFDLAAGQRYFFEMNDINSTINVAYIHLYNTLGYFVKSASESNNLVQSSYVPTTSGIYYLDAQSLYDDSIGAYSIKVYADPSNVAPISQNSSISINEDSSYSFALSNFSFVDQDVNNQIYAIKITSLPTAGTLKYNGMAVTLDQEITAVDISAGKLVFTPAANANGTAYATFGFKVSDGVVYSTIANTVTVNVTAVSDTPTSLNATITTSEDTAKVLALSHFAFSDGDIGDTLSKVKITSLPTAGSLEYNGTAVTLNQEITASDINAGKLVFTPPVSNYDGTVYATFGFKVSDGTAYSAIANTITINFPYTELLVGTVESANIEVIGDRDWFKVDLAEGQKYLLKMETTGTGSLDTGMLVLYDTLGLLVTSTYNKDIAQIDYSSSTSGTFFIQTLEAYKTSTGSYTLLILGDPNNSTPTSANTAITTNEDTAKVLASSNFAFSDVDVNNKLYSIKITTLPTAGSLQYNGTSVTLNQEISTSDINAGKLVYTPAANGNGTGYASFRFKVSDGLTYSTSANTVTVNVTAINDAPTASNAIMTTNEDTAKVLALSNFSFSDVDTGDTLSTVKITTLPTAGSLEYNGTAVTLNQEISASDINAGKLVYTPEADGNGTGYSSFGFKVSDGLTYSTSANTVTVNVTAVNDAPTASNAIMTTNEDTALNGTLPTANDVDGDAITYTKVTNPSHGTVTIQSNGAYTYTPTANYNGSDSFTYKVSDTKGGSSTYTADVTINSVNDAPTSTNGTITTNEDTAKVLALSNFSFSDVDTGDTLSTVKITTLPTAGSLEYNGTAVTLNQEISASDINAGKLVYTPEADGNGTGYASFGFKVSDGLTYSTSANTVTVNVTAVNDAPTASNAIMTTNEDTALNGTLPTANDVDGDAITYAKVTNPSHGTVTIQSNGAYTYTPTANYNGSDSFTYKVSDTKGGSSTYTADVTINSVNDAPTSTNGTITTNEDTAKVLALSNFAFSDVDTGDTLSTVKITTLPTAGLLEYNGTAVTLNQEISASDINAGKLVYTPEADGNGTGYASFGFKLSDGTDYSASAYTSTVNVSAVNDAPSITSGSTGSVAENAPISTVIYDVNGVDLDSGAILTYSVSGSDASLLNINSSTGEVTLKVSADYETKNSYSFNVIASDGSLSDTKAVTVSVSDINEIPNTPPTASNTVIQMNENSVLNGVLPAATDIDGDTISYALNNEAHHGSISVNTNGNYTYTPDSGFSGIDLFTYTVSDGNGGENSYSAKVKVSSAQPEPQPSAPGVTFDDVAKLYVATFNRAPDAAGLNWWVYNSGLGIEQIAQSFFDQPETKALYPTGTSNTSFVTSVYDNLFNRAPDQAGLEYWVGELDSGRVAKQNFILAMMNGALDSDVSLDKTILDNKMNVGLFFVQEGLNDVDVARSVMENVNSQCESVDNSIQIMGVLLGYDTGIIV